MAPRKKTAAKKKRSLPKKAKKTTARATRTKPKRVKRRETPLEKLAFRVSVLEEGFDELERDLRNLRHAYAAETAHAVVIPQAEPEAIDVSPEPEVVHALDKLDESNSSTNE